MLFLEMVFAIVLWLFLVFILALVAFGAASIAVVVSTSAVIFSKIGLSALLALAFSRNALVATAFINYLIWFAIVLGIVMILSILPRVDIALKYLCTSAMAFLAVGIAMIVVIGIINIFAKNDMDFGTGWRLLSVIITSVISFMALFAKIGERAEGNRFYSNKLIVFFDRVLASLIYGLTTDLMVLFVGVEIPLYVEFIILGIGAIVAFILDIFLLSKEFDGATHNAPTYTYDLD